MRRQDFDHKNQRFGDQFKVTVKDDRPVAEAGLVREDLIKKRVQGTHTEVL